MTWTVPAMMDELGLSSDVNNQKVGAILAKQWRDLTGRDPGVIRVGRQHHSGQGRFSAFPNNWREFGEHVAVRVARGTYRPPRQGVYTGRSFGW